MAEKRREEVAWLLWCANEGYLLKEDRDVLTEAAAKRGEEANMFLLPVESLHPNDQRDREGWLQLADAVIEAIEAD